MTDGEKLSAVEVMKLESDYLRGDLARELVDGSDCFSKASVQMLKHHGAYQHDDRDSRQAARACGKVGKSHRFMVRSRIPGGRLTSGQLMAQLDLCDETASGALRITSRQGLQLHGIPKSDLRRVIGRINEMRLTTLAACGDVQRNVMCCPAPYAAPAYGEAQELADRMAAHFSPRTTAYDELWLMDPANGERQRMDGDLEGGEVEPIYGPRYLPRKFKTAIGFPHDNCVDIYTHDLGFLAIVEDDRIVGYNVLVGGGLGVTPAVKTTFPALAKKIAFATPDQALDVATAVVKVQRDYGDRSDRRTARLKYLIHNWGIEKFRAKVEEYYGGRLSQPRAADVYAMKDHLGWEAQGDGRWFYGLNVENGRIRDSGKLQLKSALRAVCRRFDPGIRLTSHQSILLCGLAGEDKAELEEILRRHGVPLSEDVSCVRRWSMACVAWPTCGLAITESERALPGVIDQMEVELAKLGLSAEEFTVRMTGCSNGCARPYNADIGLVGKARDRYTIFLGGRRLGDRMNFVYKDLVPVSQIVPALTPLFIYFKQDRLEAETFGDFCHRKGCDDLLAWCEKHWSGTAA